MAKLVFGMMQSLDGYVDHLQLGPPGPALSRHFLEHVRNLTGCLYGRRMYGTTLTPPSPCRHRSRELNPFPR